MKLIPLTNHYEFIYVDDDDYDDLIKFKWHRNCNGYASRGDVGENVGENVGKNVGSRIFIHRHVIGAVYGEEIDHIDTNKLNCQKGNLRQSNKKLNSANRDKQKGFYKSKHKGVSVYTSRYKEKVYKKWRAYIVVDEKQISLGLFTAEVDAAKAYDKAALKYFGSHARFNFPAFYTPTIDAE